jgi:hypothetical protein
VSVPCCAGEPSDWFRRGHREARTQSCKRRGTILGWDAVSPAWSWELEGETEWLGPRAAGLPADAARGRCDDNWLSQRRPVLHPRRDTTTGRLLASLPSHSAGTGIFLCPADPRTATIWGHSLAPPVCVAYPCGSRNHYRPESSDKPSQSRVSSQGKGGLQREQGGSRLRRQGKLGTVRIILPVYPAFK